MKILAILTVLTLASIVLVQRETDRLNKDHGAEFIVRPIESHYAIAISLLQSGDKLIIIRDGKKHYWQCGLYARAGTNVTNITIDAEIYVCVGCDLPSCDVIIPASPITIEQSELH